MACKFQLPEEARIHLVFHVSQWKRVVCNHPVVTELPIEMGDEVPMFEPVAILDVRCSQDKEQTLP